MKLSEWADLKGISYLTAYRWFKSGNLPEGVVAQQTQSGTIIIKDSTLENTENVTTGFLQKMSEFTQANLSIADFAAYVLNNYQLTPHSTVQDDYKKILADSLEKRAMEFLNEFNSKLGSLASSAQQPDNSALLSAKNYSYYPNNSQVYGSSLNSNLDASNMISSNSILSLSDSGGYQLYGNQNNATQASINFVAPASISATQPVIATPVASVEEPVKSKKKTRKKK